MSSVHYGVNVCMYECLQENSVCILMISGDYPACISLVSINFDSSVQNSFYPQEHGEATTVIPEIFALLICAHLIFVVYYLQFQVAVKLCCSKNLLQLNF